MSATAFVAIQTALMGALTAAPALAGGRIHANHLRPIGTGHATALVVRLDQSAADFLYLYGMPNFMFHLTMGYAALRASGVALGKADFDGFHAYPPP